MRKVLYPGTFDPPSLGHIEMIKRASKLFDHLIVGIGHNPSKGKPLLDLKQRVDSLKQETSHLSNVEVVSFSGLVTTFAKESGVDALLRGLRSDRDLENEIQMASANKAISGIETMFLPADSRYASISSTLIRELAQFGAPLNAFIPEGLVKILQHQKEK